MFPNISFLIQGYKRKYKKDSFGTFQYTIDENIIGAPKTPNFWCTTNLFLYRNFGLLSIAFHVRPSESTSVNCCRS